MNHFDTNIPIYLQVVNEIKIKIMNGSNDGKRLDNTI